MTKGVRRKLINMVKEKLAAKLFFRTVVFGPPATFPISHDTPAIYLTRGVETLDALTNEQKESRLPLEIVAVVESAEELELVKADAEDEIEEALMDLQTETAFTDLATMIEVSAVDGTPTALTALGLDIIVLPPYGLIRVSATVLFRYDAI